jgi:hypothetical protein
MAISVKVNKDDLLKLRIKVEKSFREATSQQTMQKLGDEAATQIKKRTRLGSGVEESGQSSKLAPLAKSTKDARAGRIAFFKNKDGVTIPYKPDSPPKLHEQTKPSKSNLTFTGQMLDSITTKNAAPGKFSLGFKEGRTESNKKNSDIAKYAEEGSSNRPKRRFFDLASFEVEEIKRTIREKIKKLLGD